MRQVEPHILDSHDDALAGECLRQISARIGGKGIYLDADSVEKNVGRTAGLDAQDAVVGRKTGNQSNRKAHNRYISKLCKRLQGIFGEYISTAGSGLHESTELLPATRHSRLGRADTRRHADSLTHIGRELSVGSKN